MIQIPKPAGLLGRLAAKETSRYCIAGVQVTADGEEARLVATDGHVLGIVRGPAVPPGSEACVLVPLQAWTEAFKHVGKSGTVECNAVQLVAGARSKTVVPFEPVDGRFPDYMRLLTTQLGLPIFRANLNPRLLIRVLEVAAAISETVEGQCRVELFCYQPGKPIGIVAVGADGLTFDGIIMPLS